MASRKISYQDCKITTADIITVCKILRLTQVRVTFSNNNMRNYPFCFIPVNSDPIVTATG